jgi:hypothetical protein
MSTPDSTSRTSGTPAVEVSVRNAGNRVLGSCGGEQTGLYGCSEGAGSC